MVFQEKRRTPRVSLTGKVRVETKRGAFHGQGRDLSEGGMGVYLRKLPEVGSTVEVQFRLPRAEEQIEATAEVRYHRREGPGIHDDWVGLKFVRMGVDSQKRIKAYVKENFDGSKPHVPAPPPNSK